ncbi:hypothetical protein LTR56_004274 [Elasticomyces elasticus]|nr:hypothetical protein LTR22_020663 [Elasticomyces elasticus]KAK3653864.1 hypothetical protein LTR56_004274 [Elasticomyces elasticus]KAK4919341.1 hypothetical protein LTR49_013041 [Elasticomyces elasticus]KAK5749687.1 hypothetical protein LTS12_020256 [Elasticomyces elasticus]
MGRPSRRQQTRLTFTPMPSSSPATKGYPQQIKERAAAVGYAGSSSKRRKLREADDAPFGVDGANDMPTPAATMNLDQERISSDEEEPVASNTRLTSRKRSRQQALDFSKARDSSSFDSAVQLHSSPRTRTQRAGMFSGTQSRRSRKAQKTVDISSGEEESEEEEQDDEQPAVSSRKLKPRGSQRPVLIDSDDEEEGDAVVTSSRPPATAPLVESDEDEEDMPTTQGRQPRRKRQPSRDSFISSSPPRAIESDSDDLEIIEKPKSSKRGRRRRESDEVQPTPSRRKLSKRPRQMSQKEQEELNEDLDFLGPSSDVEALERQPRSTQDKQKMARQSALQKLKQKRSGLPEIVEVEDGEEEDADDGADAQDDDDDIPEVTSSRKMFHAEEEDDAFIDSDPEGTLGVPDVQIPLAFTSQASAKPKELFKHAVEWFVQRKINPAFNMHDELYELTFQKLDDEVQGLAGSKFKSAAWTPAFYAAITARPEIAIDELDRHGEDWLNDGKCDACNRSGHPATFSIQFQGKPYNPHTLEDVGRKRDDDDDSSSSEEEEDDTQPTRDYRGNKVPPANIIYKVGKFCKANADTAHALQHWRHHLDSQAMLWMTAHGYLTDEKIIKRDGQSMKKRQKEANRITDHMETDGHIRTLWDAYRQTIDDARNSKQGRFAAGS